MSNPFDELRGAIYQARELDRAVATYAGTLASLLRGKLHHCSDADLCALKKELQDYNMHTGVWKNKP